MKAKCKKSNSKGKIIKILLGILVTILIVLLGAGTAVFIYINDNMGKMNKVKIDETQIEISTNENLNKYRNIAIFGVDSRKDDYGTGNRSDCIIIASINTKTNDINLVSVYRDTYVQIDGYGLDKITHAYSYGEAPLALKTLNKNLDLNIKEFVTVNFDAVADAVEELGGIQINITSEEVKYINEYINETSKVTGKKSQEIQISGTQILDGVQAVAYSRIRYTSGGEYKRTERMRDVITAMMEKLKTKSIGEINKITDKILPQVYTNIELRNLLSMVPMLSNFDINESIGWPYETKGITLDRWYGVPVILESNVKKLHKEVFDDINYEVPNSIKEISQNIVSKTGYKY